MYRVGQGKVNPVFITLMMLVTDTKYTRITLVLVVSGIQIVLTVKFSMAGILAETRMCHYRLLHM